MKINFVLVEPRVPENIGASARAIKTMGFDSLVLVNPCEYKEGKARWVAHGSADILDNAKVYVSLSEALSDSDFAIATSIRRRIVKIDILYSPDLPEFLISKSGYIKNVSLVFGREEAGLTNDEIQLCDIISAVPMQKKYPSLNLAQAVMIYAYELSRCFRNLIAHENTMDHNSYSAMKNKVRQLLYKIGLTEADNRFGRIIERVAFLKDGDINLVHTICNLLDERLDCAS